MRDEIMRCKKSVFFVIFILLFLNLVFPAQADMNKLRIEYSDEYPKEYESMVEHTKSKFYTFNVLAGQTITIIATSKGSFSEVKVYVRYDSELISWVWVQSKQTKTIQFMAAFNGIYEVEVYGSNIGEPGFFGTKPGNHYKLKISLLEKPMISGKTIGIITDDVEIFSDSIKFIGNKWDSTIIQPPYTPDKIQGYEVIVIFYSDYYGTSEEKFTQNFGEDIMEALISHVENGNGLLVEQPLWQHEYLNELLSKFGIIITWQGDDPTGTSNINKNNWIIHPIFNNINSISAYFGNPLYQNVEGKASQLAFTFGNYAFITAYEDIGRVVSITGCLHAPRGEKNYFTYNDNSVLLENTIYWLLDHISTIEPILRAQWTFMVYLDGDNDLEPTALKDINRMEKVGSTSEINILALLDRHHEYDSSDGDWTGTRLYKIEKDEMSTIQSQLLEDWGEQNMGGPQTLSRFVKTCMEDYPAEHYALVLMDHGGGWQGTCHDMTDGSDSLNLPEIGEVLSDLDYRIDLIAFEACLMNMAEVAYQIKDYVDVMVASEDLIRVGKTAEASYFGFFPYDTILADLAANPDMGAEELASVFINWFKEEHQKLFFKPVEPWGTLSAMVQQV